jgi:hypothetical protein
MLVCFMVSISLCYMSTLYIYVFINKSNKTYKTVNYIERLHVSVELSYWDPLRA